MKNKPNYLKLILQELKETNRLLAKDTITVSTENSTANVKYSKSSIFPIWKTITLTLEKNIYQRIIDSGMKVSSYAESMIKNISVVKKDTELDLVVVSVKDLGFDNGASLQDIYRKANKMGLELCPAQVGPQLRLQYEDQPKDEWLIIGMEPITDSVGVLCVFHVAHNDNALWLRAYCDDPGLVWFERCRFVFVLPCK